MGDNTLDVEKLKMVCRSIFKLNSASFAVFSETTGKRGILHITLLLHINITVV